MSKERQISIIGEDIRPIDPEFDNDNQLSFAWELWFDVDAYFGTEIEDSDNWVNLYTFYHRDTDKITAEIVIDKPENSEYREWKLTAEEERFIRDKLDKFCQKDDGLNLKDYFDKFVRV